MALSVRQCGVSLVESTKALGGAELPNGDRTPMRYVKSFSASADSLEQIEAAQRRLDHSRTPPTNDQATGWIAELSVITARRPDDDLTEDLRASAYSRRLAEYPADVARHAVLVHRWKFFPTWAELADVCDELVADRNRLQFALNQAAASLRERGLSAKALPDEASAVMTPEERAASRQRVSEMLEQAAAKMRARADAADAEMAAKWGR